MLEVKCVLYASIASVSLALGLLILLVPYWLDLVDNFQRDMALEISIFRANSNDMWADLLNMQGSSRIRRQDFLYTSNSNYNSIPAYGYGYTKLQCCCSLTGSNNKDYSRHTTSYKCPIGTKGPPGPFGEAGEPGQEGHPGFNGEDYPSLLQAPFPTSFTGSSVYNSYTNRRKDTYCEPCPPGPAGETGPKGVPGLVGTKGHKGQSGKHGIPGIPGKVGHEGEPGARGRPGRTGVAGPNGADSVKGGKGIPGMKGTSGSIGVPGPRGVSGPTGDYGIPGVQGLRGNPGVRGAPGQDGVDGVIGAPGKAGADGLYCNCPHKAARTYEYTPPPLPPLPAIPVAPAYPQNETPYKLSDAQAQYIDASYTKKIYNSVGSSNQFASRPGPPGTRPPKRNGSGYSDQKAADWPRWPEATTTVSAAVVDLNIPFGREDWFRRRSKAKGAVTRQRTSSSQVQN